MKKFLVFGMMSAMALTFVACSSDDELANVNPVVTGETVKTTFSINVPTKHVTRMTAGQAGELQNTATGFTGIEDIVLFPFAKGSAIEDGDIVTLEGIELEALTDWTSNGSANKFNGKVYNDVEVPVGVDWFLFYGKVTGSNGEGELEATVTTANGTAIEENVKFDLVPVTEKTVADLSDETDGAAVLEALQDVSDAFVAQIAAATTAGHTSLGILTDLKTAFEKNKAGSAASVQALFDDLSTALTPVAGTYAAAVKAAITDLSSNTFPAGLKLPDGAVGVQCTSGTWAFAATNTNGLGQPELNTYVKPAELYYTVNTPIHVDEVKEEPNYDAQADWADVVDLYDAGTSVTADTRAIVLDNEIQFAVAQLQSKVQIDPTLTDADATLKANDGTDQTTLIDAVKVADADFDVTAILVGGQKNLDWAFLPTGTDEFVVYDAVQTGATTGATNIKKGTASAINYTLVGETDADEVKVLVELVNNGEDFYGYNDELIPAGAKFYLLGTLKVSAATTTKNIDTVFKQDYTTVVTFTIGENSLKNAYNTIPDLRTPQLELGLSVDLEWNAGLVIESVVLGE